MRDTAFDEATGTVGEFRILLKPSTWKRVRLGEGVCRHVFLGCNAANERVVLKRQRHSWDWEKDEPMWRGGCNAIGRRMSRWPRTLRYEFGSMVGHERGPTDAYGGACLLCLR